MTRRFLPTFLLVLVLGACFNPSLGDQPFKCGAGGDCPPGYTCDLQAFCIRNGSRVADSGPGQPDAIQPGDDGGGGGGVDARPRADARTFFDAPANLPDGGPCINSTDVVGCTDDHTALLCDGSTVACAFHCDAQARLCEQCDPMQPTFCTAVDHVATCSGNGVVGSNVACSGFCEVDSGARCVNLQPTNLPSKVCDTTFAPDLNVSASLSLDTESCVGGTKISQPPTASVTSPPQICVLVYHDITFSGAYKVSGKNALALVATHDIVLNGAINVSADTAAAGPGSTVTTPGLGTTDQTAYVSGGGGAGYAQKGGAGGGGPTASDGTVAGGNLYGGQDLVPLVGGSSGGDGGSPNSVCPGGSCPIVAKGGGGGGALQLVACHALALGDLGHLFAVGGGGGGGGGAPLSTPAPGSKGENGMLDQGAQGGAGGAQMGGMGGNGSNGPLTSAPLPGIGAAPTNVTLGDGGGGGAIGRIRLNASAVSGFDPGTLIIVPVPAVGIVKSYH